MGYTTDFAGVFTLDEPLTEEQAAYLTKFCETRRVKRDTSKLLDMEDQVREAVGLPLGKEGEFFTGGLGLFGQGNDPSILDHNRPARTQPGLWCQWVPTEDCSGIMWDGSEKFYNYVEWLEYIVQNFLIPWGRKLNGEVSWSGEDVEDVGVIVVKDNNIKVHYDAGLVKDNNTRVCPHCGAEL